MHSRTIIVDELVDELFDAEDLYMPVRVMEALLDVGEAAVEPLLELVRDVEGEHYDQPAVWAAIVLGRLRAPAAAPEITGAIARLGSDALSFALPAAEALAAIGAPALPAIRTLAASERSWDRTWAYYAAGLMRDTSAYAFLVDALETDLPTADVVALALGDHGDAAAIEPLGRTLARVEPWQRPELESAIQELHRGVTTRSSLTDDWRIRYRVNEAHGRFPMTWPVIVTLARDMPARRAAAPPLRTLHEILADEPEPVEPKVCDCCDRPLWQATGAPVCARTAAALPIMQAHLLTERSRAIGSDDLFDLLGDIEADLLASALEPEPRSRRARERHEDEVGQLRIAQAATTWAVQHGAEFLDAACDLLIAEAERAAQEHGDPMGVLRPEPPPVPAAPRAAGRNDPCPCGSGRKYKKCCGAPGATPAASDPLPIRPTTRPGPPKLVTFDDEPLVFSKAHYEVTDPDAVVHALRLVHQLDTGQDPAQAMAEARRHPKPPRDEVPPEVAGPAIRQVQDRFYRTWPDEPLPALGGQTARQAIRTAEGRRRVTALLRSFDEGELRRPPELRYDFTWIWNELGLER
jgi:SEC-C motif/Protein of unknown function (DUF2384)